MTRPGLLWGLSALAATMILTTPAPAEIADGEAFGIRMGTPTAQLDVDIVSASADPSVRIYGLRSVPKPHPLLNRYDAHSGNAAGACSIGGSIASQSVDHVDHVEKQLTDEMEQALGKPRVERYPVSGNLVEAWHKALGSADLGRYPDDQRTYTWTRNALTRDIILVRWLPNPNTLAKPAYLEHRLSLTFNFKNYVDCVKEGEELKRRR